MLSKSHRTFSLIALVAVGAVGCSAVVTSERVIREVQFSGHYNDINGVLSDGTPFTGKGWFKQGTTRGDFCLQAAEIVCSGKHSATLSRRISGDFVCSDGTTGSYQTERVPQGSFVVPISGTGTLSDGRTAEAEFSPLEEGPGQATCFVPETGS
jgi:hypothetical protein